MHWGNYIWNTFHMTSYTYIPDKKKRYINLIKYTGDLLPCHICVHHFKKMVQKTNLNEICDNKESLIEWFNKVHNKVNKRLYKRQIPLYEANRIYMQNGIPNINHTKLAGYIDIISKNSGLNMVIREKKIRTIENLCHIFPCIECRDKLIPYIIKYNGSKLNIEIWINGILDIINKHKQQIMQNGKNKTNMIIKDNLNPISEICPPSWAMALNGATLASPVTAGACVVGATLLSTNGICGIIFLP